MSEALFFVAVLLIGVLSVIAPWVLVVVGVTTSGPIILTWAIPVALIVSCLGAELVAAVFGR